MAGLGLYVHIPFCAGKCPYCDFFSVPFDERTAYAYAEAVIRNALHYRENYNTVYFGGGTPWAVWWDISRILAKLKFTETAEVTVEANPNTLTKESLLTLKNSGVNRISVGVQSFSNGELRALGRAHSSEDASQSIRLAKESGFENISADLMLGIPNQTPDSVRRSIKVLAALDVQHVSAYILKIEPKTPFANMSVKLPDENTTAQIYLAAAGALEENGFTQYEVSNFAKKGFECRHNLKYWRSEEYLGIGTSAHSFYDGERFFVFSNIKEFIKDDIQRIIVTEKSNSRLPDSLSGGDFDDYAMLKLRLAEGLTFAECEKFGVKKEAMMRRCKLVPPDYLKITDKGVSITREGFLVSNQIIRKLTTEPAQQTVGK